MNRRQPLVATIRAALTDHFDQHLAAFYSEHRDCPVVAARTTPRGYRCLRCATCRAEVWSHLERDPGAAR